MAKDFDQGDWGRHWTEQEPDAPAAVEPEQTRTRRAWVFPVVVLIVVAAAGGAFLATRSSEEPAAPPALALADPANPQPEPSRPDYLADSDQTDEAPPAEPAEAAAPAPAEAVDLSGLPPAAPAPATPLPAPAPAEAAAPNSYGIYRGGQIFLEGAVPTQEDSDRIAALAAEVLGPENVINNYVIDSRASDPSQGQIIVDDKVLFASGSAEVRPEFHALLNQGVLLMAIRPKVTITIVGHTDSEGSAELNDALSQARAEAAVSFMVAQGADGSRLTAVGRGEREPIATNDTEGGRLQNRRLEILIENLLS